MSRFSLEALFKGNDQVSAVIAKIQSKVSSFSSGTRATLKGIEEANSKIADSFGSIAKKAGAAGLAIGTLAGVALLNIGKTGADFEQAMANVGAVSLMTRDEVKDLEKTAIELGQKTKFSATQVAGGMELMGKAGFDNGQIIKGIGPILAAAAAEGAEFEETASHVSNVLKGMGLDVSEAGRVADVLTLASARTNSSISSLGESMANVSSTARQFKIPLEQAVASVALLQDVGLDASVAGSAFNTMLTNMANPSTKAQASMRALGISFQNSKGDMLPLQDVFAQFDKASKKSGGNMKQVAFFAELVGLRGQKAASNLGTLFKEGKFGNLVKELDAAKGSAEKMAALRMNTFSGDLTTLSNVVDTVKIGLFDLESGPLRAVVQNVTKWVQANRELIVTDVQSWIKAIADNLPLIVTWGLRLVKVIGVLMAFSYAVKTVNTAIDIGSFVAKNPYVALAIAIIAAIALVVAYWPEISAFFARLWNSIKAGAAAVGAWFARLWDGITGAFMSVWNPLAAFFVGFWNGLKAVVRGWLDFVVGLWTLELYALMTIMRAVVSFFRPIWEPVLTFFVWLWDEIKAAAAVVWDTILVLAGMVAQVLQAIWTPVAAFFGWIWGGIKTAALAAWDAIVVKARAVFAAVKVIWTPIAAFFSGLWDGIASVFNTVIGTIVKTVEALVSGIERAVKFVQGIGHGVVGSALGEGDDGGGDGPQVVSPGDRTASSLNEYYTHNTGEITVRAEPGSSASVSKPPGGGFSLGMAPSGGF